MKIILIIGALALLGGLYFWYANSENLMVEDKEAVTVTDGSESITVTDEGVNVTAGNNEDISSEHEMSEEGLENTDSTVSGNLQFESESSIDQAVAAENEANQIFTITGKNFEYNIDEIRVKKGDTVTVNFASTDGFHNWGVDEFMAVTKKVRPGTMTSVTFVANKVGTFEYYCSVGSHRENGMVGKLIVE